MNTAAQTVGKQASSISALQGDAWAVWNASYRAEEREPFHALSIALYQQDITERIAALFARSDEQNRHIDLMLNARENTQS
jgi:hypothetical protein